MTEPPDFDRLFRSVTLSADHLEMRDDYGASSPAFAAWREHRPYDRSRPDAAWHALVGSVTGRGATVRRARIVSEPDSNRRTGHHPAQGDRRLPAHLQGAGSHGRPRKPRQGAHQPSCGRLRVSPRAVAQVPSPGLGYQALASDDVREENVAGR
jgi:hypothetical protein